MRKITLYLWLIIAMCGCAAPRGETTVVWISIDGLRHDYVDLYKPPTLTRLAHEGAVTNAVVPIFPSLTFPNHIAQATGTTVDKHGIPLNVFFDELTQQTYSFPHEGSALRAEPIWVTAKRQGVRVGVFDWPMSHAQQGPNASDYFWELYGSLTDEERLDRVAQTLHADRGQPPLRLIIAYMAHVDQVAHRAGAESEETRQALLGADREIDKFVKSVITWFDTTHSAEDQLYILLTTDHGMLSVRTLVNLDLLLGAELSQGAKSLTSGPVGCIYLGDVPAEQRSARAEQIVARLRQNPFVSCWKSAEVPERFHFGAAGRIGDVVVLLAPGYNFTTIRLAATQPVAAGASAGAHGYDPGVSPDMLGAAIVWRYRHPMNGADLGPIENTQWHATVAKWLGIEPAAGSDLRAIRLP